MKPKIKFNKVIQKSNEEVDAASEVILLEKALIKEKPSLVKKTDSIVQPVKIVTKKDDQPKKELAKENIILKKDETPKKEIIMEKQNTRKEEIGAILKKEEQEKLKDAVDKERIELGKKEDKLVNKDNQKKEEVPLDLTEKVQISKQVKPNTAPYNREKREIEDKTAVTKTGLTNGYIVNPSKDKKKKKNELNALQQLTAAPGGPGMAFILNMVHKAELSHEDIQLLIDLLLNKQLDNPTILDDWSEGKSDPVQKLKKQLAEKEKALLDEQEALAGVQLKLKEIRNEQLTERSVLNQKIKTLEEQLQNQQMEMHACNNRYHAQAQQLQQAQVQLNEERIKMHTLREELGAVQMQRQQLELHITQESEVIIAQLRADIQEYSARNEQLLIDINHIQKVAADNEASYVAQLNNITQELTEKSRQLEELSIELANKDEILFRQEGELKTEIAQMNTVMQQQAEEIRKSEQGQGELMEEINNLKKQKNISSKVITQLKSEIEKLQQEKSQNEASIENNKINETEVLNLKNELTSVRNKLEENEKHFIAEVETKTNLLNKLEGELEEQKTKNNELRNKNYKIMEALNAAESRIKNEQIDNANKEKDSQNNRMKEIDCQKKFLARILPELNGLEDLPSEKWEEESLKLVCNYVETLKKPAVGDSTENLQARIEHYQNVIKDTEGMLSKLQAHIDQEQISWKAQIKSKDLELEALKEKLEKSPNLENINGSSVGQ
ncbi:hypothetical protein HHI36_002878 [Cryptolaemus montrouzieri]|uniref:Uncharacterized protein n=1 Tax=Cryptolaemus montrouzieri TaxID=559131 RepID=A0ABD2PCL3_9CUCU